MINFQVNCLGKKIGLYAIDDFKISELLYSRPENSKWGEQNFQNGGFLYDFFINFRNFERIKVLDSRLKRFIKFKMNMKFQS